MVIYVLMALLHKFSCNIRRKWDAGFRLELRTVWMCVTLQVFRRCSLFSLSLVVFFLVSLLIYLPFICFFLLCLCFLLLCLCLLVSLLLPPTNASQLSPVTLSQLSQLHILLSFSSTVCTRLTLWKLQNLLLCKNTPKITEKPQSHNKPHLSRCSNSNCQIQRRFPTFHHVVFLLRTRRFIH